MSNRPPRGPEDLSPHEAQVQSQGRRVLLADDNADMRGYVARLLSQSGYRVQAVVDGAAALAAAREHKPDLILSDVMMPRLDGFQLLGKLREEQALADVRLRRLHAGPERHRQQLEHGGPTHQGLHGR
jgi:CheY-like chemotaxis protein